MNTLFQRSQQIKLGAKNSAFLWGPRQVGKSTLLRQQFPNVTRYDFLQTENLLNFIREPSRLRKEIQALHSSGKLQMPVILDEVQKVPNLLDEVHWLIENFGIQFVLCGSSARKLKKNQANLLGGRAWKYVLSPLTMQEVTNFDLLRALNQGLIPNHYLENIDLYQKALKAYVDLYVKEEIINEAVVRDAASFTRFTDVLGFATSEMVNYANIARDVGVDSKTIAEYFRITEDIFLGQLVKPFSKSAKREIISRAPKFYLFDVGVAGHLSRRVISHKEGSEFGRAFEHFIYMELLAYLGYNDVPLQIQYWRTKTGDEVDFILDRGNIAIEVKGKAAPTNKDTRGLRLFGESFGEAVKKYLVCDIPREQVWNGIRVMPWVDFLEELWAGKVV